MSRIVHVPNRYGCKFHDWRRDIRMPRDGEIVLEKHCAVCGFIESAIPTSVIGAQARAAADAAYQEVVDRHVGTVRP
jgi:hypothetical protein